jgi:hypothetical protein
MPNVQVVKLDLAAVRLLATMKPSVWEGIHVSGKVWDTHSLLPCSQPSMIQSWHTVFLLYSILFFMIAGRNFLAVHLIVFDCLYLPPTGLSFQHSRQELLERPCQNTSRYVSIHAVCPWYGESSACGGARGSLPSLGQVWTLSVDHVGHYGPPEKLLILIDDGAVGTLSWPCGCYQRSRKIWAWEIVKKINHHEKGISSAEGCSTFILYLKTWLSLVLIATDALL